MNRQTVIFMGSQGSGKGTQSKLLKKYLDEHSNTNTEVFESGQYFRDLTTKEGYTAELIQESLEKGEILPDFFAVWMWTSSFMNYLDENENIIIDGFPRTVRQARLLDDTFEFYKRHNVLVVNLQVSEEVAIERLLSRGRSDDTKEGIEKRLGWYHKEVEPVLEYYRSHDVCQLVDIDGERSVEEIHAAIVEKLTH